MSSAARYPVTLAPLPTLSQQQQPPPPPQPPPLPERSASPSAIKCGACGFNFPSDQVLAFHTATVHASPVVTKIEKLVDLSDDDPAPIATAAARHPPSRSLSVMPPVQSSKSLATPPATTNAGVSLRPPESQQTNAVKRSHSFERPRQEDPTFLALFGATADQAVKGAPLPPLPPEPGRRSTGATAVTAPSVLRLTGTRPAKVAPVMSLSQSQPHAARPPPVQTKTTVLVDLGDLKPQRPKSPASPQAKAAKAPVIALLRPKLARMTEEQSAVVIQSLVRGHLTRRWARPELFRYKVVKEACESERSYVRSLQGLIDVFVSPLRKRMEQGKAIICAKDLGLLFSQLEAILRFNSENVLSRLVDKVNRWHVNSAVGVVFAKLDYKAMYELYSDFTAAYWEILGRFEELRASNSKFNEFVKTCERHFWNDGRHAGNSFDSYLILPVQRVPRYALLLRELLKHTHEGHRDYQGCRDALTNMEDLCKRLNERQRAEERERERTSKLFEIARQIEPRLANLTQSSTRRFLAEYDASVLVPDAKRMRSRHVFVFDDLLIVTKTKKSLTSSSEGGQGAVHKMQRCIELSSRVRIAPSMTEILGVLVNLNVSPNNVVGIHQSDAVREDTLFLVFDSPERKKAALETLSLTILKTST